MLNASWLGRRAVTALAVVFILAGRDELAAQAQQPAAAALAQTAELAPLGFSLRYPAGWTAEQDANVWRLVNVPPERARAMTGAEIEQVAQILVTSETRRNHADALRRLKDVEAESTTSVTFLTINGWPALQRRYVGSREQPGDVDIDDRPDKILRVVTAIAADRLLIRFDGRLPANAPPALEETVRAIGRSPIFRTPGNNDAGQREVQGLRAAPRLRAVPPPRGQARTARPGVTVPGRGGAGAASPQRPPASTPRAGGGGSPGSSFPFGAPGLAQRVILGGVASEAEIAVSTNGQDIVIGQQRRFTTSNNGGLTFGFNGSFAGSTGGDASMAFGRSGTFYEGTIAGRSTAINVSTNNGQTFAFRANAFTCPTTGPNQCGANFPDQEHIAADRFNSAPTGDQVYSVWRHLNGNYGIVCSTDGGQNWTAAAFTAGDLPRIAIGPDGSVFVTYQSGNNVMLNRYSSCAAGLAVQAGFPLNVATVGPSWVSCPVPGLDRCNNGNNLSSFIVAVDDTNANHVYVAYAQNTSMTENVIVRDSTDGGLTWPAGRVVTVNSGVNARRFMPWLCTANGVAYASWFDRRAATATNNSLTDFFSGSASLNGAGNLVTGTEVQVNAVGSADAQCNAGKATGSAASWPGASRAITDSTSCRPQPQLGGQCQHSPTVPTDSLQACNLSGGTICPGTESCLIVPLGGTPKYGDYNGNACAAGRFYTIWPSATPPPGTAVTTNIDLYFSARVVAASQIQVPGPVVFDDTCVGSSSLATANICNSGKTDLHIDPITSSDPQFSVVTPSSGYPVTI